MMQITDAAADVLKQVRAQSDIPEDAALRIQPVEKQGDSISIGFAFSEGPQQGDETVRDQEDLTVYLAGELSAPLSEAVLDAAATDQGVQLELRDLRGHEGHQHG